MKEITARTMLTNKQKKLTSTIVLFCFLCGGCGSYDVKQATEETTKVKSVAGKPEPKKIDISSYLSELTQEELEQEIKECEDSLKLWLDPKEVRSQDDHFTSLAGIVLTPLILPYYFNAKMVYIKQYGTAEQKRALEEYKTSSNNSPEQFHDFLKLLDLPPYLSEFFRSASYSHEDVDVSKRMESILKKQNHLTPELDEKLRERLEQIFR